MMQVRITISLLAPYRNLILFFIMCYNELCKEYRVNMDTLYWFQSLHFLTLNTRACGVLRVISRGNNVIFLYQNTGRCLEQHYNNAHTPSGDVIANNKVYTKIHKKIHM